jgi:MFS family permease
MVQATAVACYAFARDLAEFYSVAAVFGFAYAGIMPLYTVLLREHFPVSIIGTVVRGRWHPAWYGGSAR